ncbi:MAG: Nramp family divalent metal transporter [Pseudomonadota bacterium]|nr:Nramp family divalent metal transporter [Pseudomonadota bacterium]
MTKLTPRLSSRIRLAGIMAFLGVIGPGIITANVDNDAGGITTYSLAGAQFGHAFLWTLFPITLLLILVQEMSARMGVVTGKGFADLIREHFGVRWTFYILLMLLVANLGNTLSEFAGVAASMEIFGFPKYLSVPLTAAFVWWLVVKGSYRSVEKVFLFASFFYVCYLASGFLAAPHWAGVIKSSLIPSWSGKPAYLAMFIGMVGTTIAPWMQFYLQSSVVDKKIQPKDYWVTRWDVIVGCFATDIVAYFIIVACAATIYAHGLSINSARDAAVALAPLAGKWASLLFAFGLFNASVFSASILPLSTAYSMSEGMGWESGVDHSFREAPAFYSLYTGLIVLGAGLILIPHAPLIPIMYWSQVANGILLPFVLILMLVLINQHRLMGEHVNGPVLNVTAWVAIIFLVLLNSLLLLTTLFPSFLTG